MSPKLQPVRGTHDIFSDECLKRERMLSIWNYVCACYGYGEISTPIFEFSEVFHRTLGETSDVVNKETYSFEDRGGESLTLRPEFTASVVRAFISGGYQDKLPFKVFYHGPAFRYERPQKGRLRQFHQFGAECLGDASPLADAQMIAMAAHGLHALGLKNHISLQLNSLGDQTSRAAYRAALVEYFTDHKNQLSDDSKARLEKNPLRILDSKDEADKKINTNAPAADAYFTDEAKAFYGQVCTLLDSIGVAYTHNSQLVRGLDYYEHTVFEFTTEDLGAQGTLLGGGRYNGLVAMMGGQDIPGIGFAAGMERMLALMEIAGTDWPKPLPSVAIIPVGDSETGEALKLAQDIRKAGFATELYTQGNLSKKMKKAHKQGAFATLMLGEEEVAQQTVTVKQLDDGSQITLPCAQVVQHIAQQIERIFAK